MVPSLFRKSLEQKTGMRPQENNGCVKIRFEANMDYGMAQRRGFGVSDWPREFPRRGIWNCKMLEPGGEWDIRIPGSSRKYMNCFPGSPENAKCFFQAARKLNIRLTSDLIA